MRRLSLLLLLPVLLLWSGRLLVHAGGPTVHEVAGAEAFAEGELDALSLDQDGVLRPGPRFVAHALDADTAWAAVVHGDVLWVATGNEGILLRVPKDGETLRIETGESLLVTALAPLADGGVFAAVHPGARLLKVSAEGETSSFATLPVEHVWALHPDGRGGLVVATGLPGALFRVDPFGAVEKLVEVDDDHARCLARNGDELLVGTSPKGRILAVRDGDVRVVRDLDAQEVVGIVPQAGGGLLVAANADQAGGNAQMIANLLNQMVRPAETKPGQKPQPRASLQDGLALWLEPSGAITTLWSEKKVAALGLVPDGAGAVLGTYPAGRVVRVEPKKPSAIHADLPEAEASVLVARGEGLEAVITSNPAVLHRREAGEAKGTWTSAPLDAGATARWGRIRVSGEGVEALQYRSGETKEPDEAWTDWRPAAAFDGEGGGATATARFLQVRVTIAGADAAIRRVSVVAAAPNRSPVITELTVTREGEKKNGTAPPEATPKRVVAWKAEDPDGDRLRVRLHAQREGSPLWIPLVEDRELEKPTWTWDTAGLPDGTYRIRLVVSDAPDTPAERARDTASVSPPFRVDNTAPHVKVRARVAGERLLVEGEAVDQPGGRIAAVRVAVDGGPWQVVAPVDGILDEAAESFEASLPSPGSGPHDVVVQARDAEGNLGAAATVVRVR